jgi:hypothetical protein
MAIGDDISVAANGDIRWTGTTPTYTVLEFHRWLQDLADDAVSSGDDLLDITDTNPSERSTDNIITLLPPYNIDDTLAEHLYDGSITQDNGATRYSGLVVVGSVTAGTQLQIVQNNALLTNYWGTGLNADAAQNILLRIMVKTRQAGADIDGNRLRVQARELGSSYAEFSLTATLGNSTAAIFTSGDLNNATAEGTIATWSDITNTEGLNLLDVDGNAVNEQYYSQWDLGSRTINQLYERTKWIQRRGTAETIHGMNGELFRGITHSIAYDGEAGGPFTQNEVLTFGNGATAALLALDDQGSSGTLYVQLLTGVAPTDNDTITGGTSSATANVAVTVTARTISPAFIGQSTGSSVIGAYGIGIDPADLTANDQLFDLTNTLVTPPNNVTFTVNGLVSGEDYIHVGPESLGTLQDDQLSANGAQTSGAGTFVVNEVIPSDTPSSGSVRIFNGNTFDPVPYSSYSGSTFTLTGTLPNNVADGADAYIAYIDELATGTTATFTSVFSAPRSLLIRMRDGGGTPVKPFETTGTLGAAGGSATVIRTSDA